MAPKICGWHLNEWLAIKQTNVPFKVTLVMGGDKICKEKKTFKINMRNFLSTHSTAKKLWIELKKLSMGARAYIIWNLRLKAIEFNSKVA